jgi:hypothetical protein
MSMEPEKETGKASAFGVGAQYLSGGVSVAAEENLTESAGRRSCQSSGWWLLTVNRAGG